MSETTTTETMQAKRYLTQKEVQDRLGVGRTKLWQIRKSGKLRYSDLGGSIRFDPADVDAYVASQKVQRVSA